MAIIEFQGQKTQEDQEIKNMMEAHGFIYERWGTRDLSNDVTDDQVLGIYSEEIQKLKSSQGYLTEDLVALRPETPNLPAILAKFDKEHHHSEDEVRFVVEGEGVFELVSRNPDAPKDEMIKFTAQPGDLIVVPAGTKHLFYLTDKKNIRCIRLFKDPKGWEAIYS